MTTESASLFGPAGTMIGIVTPPSAEARKDVAILMFNAGVLPRIGPRRMNVKLARALAAAGHVCCRFDLSGQGDSRGAATAVDFSTQALHDIQAAMNHLETTHGIRRFALVGVCSGAVHCFKAAQHDRRVVGALMFDGHSYHTRWSRAVRHWARFREASWPGVLASARRLLRAGSGNGDISNEAQGRGTRWSTNNPPRDQFIAALQAIVDRGARMLFVYSGSAIEYYSYAGQFRHAFGKEPFINEVGVAFRPDIDHTFVSLQAQQGLIQLTLEWADRLG